MRATTVLLAGALAIAGCTVGQSDAETRAIYVDAAASAFTSGEGGPPLPDDVAGCVGEAIVDVPGSEALRDAGVDGQDLADAADLRSLDVDLPDDAVDRLAEGLAACDLAAAIERPLLDAFAAESGAPLPDAAADCVVEAADDRAVEHGLAETFVDRSVGTPGFDALLLGLAGCPEASAELLVNGFEHQLGEPLDEAAIDCIEAHVRRAPDVVAEAFTAGSGAAALQDDIVEACIVPPLDGPGGT